MTRQSKVLADCAVDLNLQFFIDLPLLVFSVNTKGKHIKNKNNDDRSHNMEELDDRASTIQQVASVAERKELKNLVTFANFRLFEEARTNCLENVEAFKLSSVGDIIDRDCWMKIDSKSLGPLSVFFEKFDNWSSSSVIELTFKAFFNCFGV